MTARTMSESSKVNLKPLCPLPLGQVARKEQKEARERSPLAAGRCAERREQGALGTRWHGRAQSTCFAKIGATIPEMHNSRQEHAVDTTSKRSVSCHMKGPPVSVAVVGQGIVVGAWTGVDAAVGGGRARSRPVRQTNSSRRSPSKSRKMVSIGSKNWWTPPQHVSKTAAEQNMNQDVTIL